MASLQTMTLRELPLGEMLQVEPGIWAVKTSDQVFRDTWGYLPGEDEVPFHAMLPDERDLWYVAKEWSQVAYLYEPEFLPGFAQN